MPASCRNARVVPNGDSTGTAASFLVNGNGLSLALPPMWVLGPAVREIVYAWLAFRERGMRACSAALSAVPANAVELVTNGDFEAGDFSGWTLTDIDPFYAAVDTLAPHSGVYGAYVGNPDFPGSLSQSIATTAAQTYTVSFWLMLENDVLGAAKPNSIDVSFGGTSLLSLTDSDAFDYRQYSYDVVAGGPSTDLVFSFYDLPAFWDLDDVSVVAKAPPAVPEPATWGLMLGGQALAGGMMRRRRTAVSFS